MLAGFLEISLGVATCLFFWTSLYFLLRYISSATKPEWHCRIITLVHAVTVTCLAGYCGFIDGPWPFTDPGGPNTDWQIVTVTVCLGYFIFDLCWCLYSKTEGITMLCHHFLSIFGLTVTLGFGIYGTEMIAAIFGSEITNPFLQLRWFIKETGTYNTWYGELNDVFFMLLFGFMRIGVGSYLLYTYFNHPRPDALGKSGAAMLYLISWIFWVGICRYAVRKYTKKFFGVKKVGISEVKNGSTEKPNRNGLKNGDIPGSGDAVKSDSPEILHTQESRSQTCNGTAVKSKCE